MSKYFYGLEGQERYTAKDPYEALEELDPDYDEIERIGLEIVEMKVSRKSGCTYCSTTDTFPSENPGWCGKGCEHYTPRNGKNGICKNVSYGLMETDRKWIVLCGNRLKKISGGSKNA